MGEQKEIVIQDDAPGASPGLSLGDIFKYLPMIQAVIEAVTAGAGSLVVKIAGKRYRITVEPA